jgi:hypothetical protein
LRTKVRAGLRASLEALDQSLKITLDVKMAKQKNSEDVIQRILSDRGVRYTQ